MKQLLTILSLLMVVGCESQPESKEIVLNKYIVPPRIVREMGCLRRLDTSYHIVTRTTLQPHPFQDDAVDSATFYTLNIGDTIKINSL
jgi:hypothetical protein